MTIFVSELIWTNGPRRAITVKIHWVYYLHELKHILQFTVYNIFTVNFQ